jgi:hypothetical protein
MLILLVLLSVCSSKYYTFTDSGATATVSFSNLSAELPEIVLIENCATSKIKDVYFENKLPNQKSAKKIKISVDKPITFEYRYSWFSGEVENLVTAGTSLRPHLKLEKNKSISICKETVTFIPQENKHYEVYFGLSNNKCVIKASEARISEQGKWISAISTHDKPKC